LTLLPLQDPRIRGVEGPRYKVGPLCEAPGCNRPVDHAHHLWRRSYLTGDYWWVEVPEALGLRTITIGNVVGLCWRHHEDVTGTVGGHKAAFIWRDGVLLWTPVEPFINKSDQAVVPTRPFEGTPEAPVSEQERCPKCGRRKPRKKPEGLPKRDPRRKTRFVLMVPKDSEEDGHALVTSLLDDCAEKMGRSEKETYYTLVDALNWFLLNYDPAEDEAA